MNGKVVRLWLTLRGKVAGVAHAGEGRGLCPHPHRGLLGKVPYVPQNFHGKGIDVLPRVVQTNITLFCLVHESFATVFCFKVTSACMGKFKGQTERYCRENLGTTLNSLTKKQVFPWNNAVVV